MAADALRDSTAVVSDVHATVLAATQTFPVGWNLYPNCTATSAGVRCTALRARPTGSWPTCEARGECSLFDYLGVAFEHDTAAFWRWFGGVFVAGLMLGLGTPFWVQAVNGLLRARQLMRGGSGDEGEGRPSSRRAAAGTAGTPTASPAAASAPPQRIRATL